MHLVLDATAQLDCSRWELLIVGLQSKENKYRLTFLKDRQKIRAVVGEDWTRKI